MHRSHANRYTTVSTDMAVLPSGVKHLFSARGFHEWWVYISETEAEKNSRENGPAG